MNEVTIPARILKELIEECTQGQLNEKSFITLEDDGKQYKFFTTQPGEKKSLVAVKPVESNNMVT